MRKVKILTRKSDLEMNNLLMKILLSILRTHKMKVNMVLKMMKSILMKRKKKKKSRK